MSTAEPLPQITPGADGPSCGGCHVQADWIQVDKLPPQSKAITVDMSTNGNGFNVRPSTYLVATAYAVTSSFNNERGDCQTGSGETITPRTPFSAMLPTRLDDRAFESIQSGFIAKIGLSCSAGGQSEMIVSMPSISSKIEGTNATTSKSITTGSSSISSTNGTTKLFPNSSSSLAIPTTASSTPPSAKDTNGILSREAKIALAVAPPIGIVGILTAIILFIRRRRRQNKLIAELEHKDRQEMEDTRRPDASRTLELEGTNAHELGTRDSRVIELPTEAREKTSP